MKKQLTEKTFEKSYLNIWPVVIEPISTSAFGGDQHANLGGFGDLSQV